MNKQLIYLLIAVLGLVVTFFATQADFDLTSMGVLVFFLIFIPTLIEPNIGFVIIIISTLFSPEIILGTTHAREITIRIEDVFLLLVIFAWFMRAVFTKNIYSVFKTGITRPFFLYILTCIISSILASIFSQINLLHSFFCILKYLQYFLLFLIVKANMKTLKQAKVFVMIFLLTAFLASLLVNVDINKQQEMGVGFFRTSPPVETLSRGESGTLGGYMIFMMAIAGGLLICTRSSIQKIFIGILLAFMFRAFLYTLSRGSYLAFIPMVAALIFFSRKFVLVYIVIAISALTMVALPPMVKDRITQTVTVKEHVSGPVVQFEDSPLDRLESWKDVLLNRFPRSPIFGHGVAKYFIDGQFFSILVESGLLGFIFFILVIVGIYREAKRTISLRFVIENQFAAGLSLGFLAGLIGLLVQAISTNTFIIIRIMEPFWFIAAIVFALPDLTEWENNTTQIE